MVSCLLTIISALKIKPALLRVAYAGLLITAQLSCEKPGKDDIPFPDKNQPSDQKPKKRILYSYTYAGHASVGGNYINITYDSLGRISSFTPQSKEPFSVFYNKDTIAYIIGPVERDVRFNRKSWIFQFDSDKRLTKVITKKVESWDAVDVDDKNPVFFTPNNERFIFCDSLVYSSDNRISEIWNFTVYESDYRNVCNISKFNYSDIIHKVPFEIIEYNGVGSDLSKYVPRYNIRLTYLDSEHPAHKYLWFMAFVPGAMIYVAPSLPVGNSPNYLVLFDQPIRNFQYSNYSPSPDNFYYNSPNYKYSYSADSSEYNGNWDPDGELAGRVQFKFRDIE